MGTFWKKIKWIHVLAAVAVSLVVYTGYLHLYIFVFHGTLPKTQILRSRNEALQVQAQMLTREMNSYSEALDALEVRDEEIYRSIFGLNSIPSSVRNAGLQGDKRYTELEYADRNGYLRELMGVSDMVLKKAYVQSKSYDEIYLMLHSADELATSIPAISPVAPDRKKFHISSVFGYREHPVLGYGRLHKGVDFSMKPGQPIFATGDGVVAEVKIERRGYGRQVVIDHGFGYKTRYAHCKNILVAEGMHVRRGEQIAISGNSGLSSGPHLHYEVIYKGHPVNPAHYYDLDIPLDQYYDIIRQAASQSEKYMPLK